MSNKLVNFSLQQNPKNRATIPLTSPSLFVAPFRFLIDCFHSYSVLSFGEGWTTSKGQTSNARSKIKLESNLTQPNLTGPLSRFTFEVDFSNLVPTIFGVCPFEVRHPSNSFFQMIQFGPIEIWNFENCAAEGLVKLEKRLPCLQLRDKRFEIFLSIPYSYFYTL